MEERHDFETLDSVVRRHVVHAVTLAHGNQRQAAALLGVSRWRLARLVKRFELHDFVTSIRGERQPVPHMRGAEPAPEVSRCDHDG